VDAIKALLVKNQPVPDEDLEFLDHGGNHVDKEHLLDNLEAASDFDHAVSALDEDKKLLVRELQRLAGDVALVPDKRKRV
jgi:hypothetical protein